MLHPNSKFGRLTVRAQVAPDVFHCVCARGTELHLWRSLLTNRVKVDCGFCVLRYTRNGRLRKPSGYWGHTRSYWTRSGKRKVRASAEFYSWSSMIGRCYCKGHVAYDTYGGRGIRVCERWRVDGGQGFKNFIDDMGPRPIGMTLDRVNPQGHYEPTNCKWSDAEEQAHKRDVLFEPGELPKIEGVRAMEERLEWELNPF